MKNIIPFIVLFTTGMAVNAQTDSLKHRAVQISFVYPVGSNGMESPSYSSTFSFNLLSGYNGGVNAIEIGGLSNMNTQSARGFQLAGILNANKGGMNGLQIGGIGNSNELQSKGVQIGGIYHFQSGHFRGTRTSGVLTLQQGDFTGANGSGIITLMRGHMNGFSGSGVASIHQGHTKGLQAAGVINIAHGGVNGVQAAGVMNLNDSMVTGAQLSPILNIGKKIRGTQIGLVNMADSSETPIGFINIIKSGSMHITIQGNDMGTTTAALKSGGKRTYGIIGFGYNTLVSNIRWSTTAGLGIHSYLSNKLHIDWELALTNHYKRFDDHDKLNLLVGFRPLLAYQFTKHLGVYAGPSVNYYITNTTQTEEIPAYDVWSKTTSGNNQYIWFGAVAGIQVKIN